MLYAIIGNMRLLMHFIEKCNILKNIARFKITILNYIYYKSWKNIHDTGNERIKTKFIS